MIRRLVLLSTLALAACDDPSAMTPASPAALQQQQLAMQQQQLALQRQALDEQAAQDQALQRERDEQARTNTYNSIQSQMDSGAIPEITVPTMGVDSRPKPAHPPTAAQIPGMQCSGEGDDASCDALGKMCADGAVRADCADAPMGQ